VNKPRRVILRYPPVSERISAASGALVCECERRARGPNALTSRLPARCSEPVLERRASPAVKPLESCSLTYAKFPLSALSLAVDQTFRGMCIDSWNAEACRGDFVSAHN